MLLLALALAQPANADLGPPPECPSGQHQEYLYGHRCVKDGYHLEAKEGGGVEEVPDAPAQAQPTAPSSAEPTAPASDDPAAPVAAEPTVAEVPAAEPSVPAAPAAQESPRCAAASGRTAGWMALLGLVMALRRRRK